MLEQTDLSIKLAPEEYKRELPRFMQLLPLMGRHGHGI